MEESLSDGDEEALLQEPGSEVMTGLDVEKPKGLGGRRASKGQLKVESDSEDADAQQDDEADGLPKKKRKLKPSTNDAGEDATTKSGRMVPATAPRRRPNVMSLFREISGEVGSLVLNT
jgi:hypothetical protein